MKKTIEDISNLAKRRGFVYPGSSIYGGLANTWDYGPLGVEMVNNIKKLWWQQFVVERQDMIGLQSSILMNPKVWEASGHVENFNDAKVDCKKCKARHRADHLIEENTDKKVEGLSSEELTAIIKENNISCPNCGAKDFTDARAFNLLFETSIGVVEGEGSRVYLRGETAQGIFVNFKNIMDTMRMRLPFGVAQVGKSFRNEITPGNFIFRLLEFEQMEIEYFIRENEWKTQFDSWLKEMEIWVAKLGIKKSSYEIREHTKDELSHYSKRTADIEYKFPFGTKELYGLAYRTDYDLQQHMKHSGQDLSYRDPKTGEKFVPHVIEPTFGLDRSFLAAFCEAYGVVEGGRTETTESKKEKELVLRLPKAIAPVKAAILPLSKKEPLQKISSEIVQTLNKQWSVQYDESASIGKRYRRQDEIGTPYCITVDFETPDDNKVTVRDRDTMAQERVAIEELVDYLQDKLGA